MLQSSGTMKLRAKSDFMHAKLHMLMPNADADADAAQYETTHSQHPTANVIHIL